MSYQISEYQKKEKINYIILCDARSLVHRISGRKDEYISIFALKRTREHFEQIFKNKFDQMTPELLSYCDQEVIGAYYQFQIEVENLKWYLVYTDDMPHSIDDHIARLINRVEKFYKELVDIIEKQDELIPEIPES